MITQIDEKHKNDLSMSKNCLFFFIFLFFEVYKALPYGPQFIWTTGGEQECLVSITITKMVMILKKYATKHSYLLPYGPVYVIRMYMVSAESRYY